MPAYLDRSKIPSLNPARTVVQVPGEPLRVTVVFPTMAPLRMVMPRMFRLPTEIPIPVTQAVEDRVKPIRSRVTFEAVMVIASPEMAVN